MPLDKGYGVLKGRAIDSKMEGREDNSPHYQVHVKAQQDYRLAINVKSVKQPFDLLYFVDDDFKHPITEQLINELGNNFFGFKYLPSKPGGMALDYIRANLFDVNKMKPLPFDLPGLDNDLNEVIDLFIKRAINSDEAIIYAFGEPWGPDDELEKVFQFRPNRGVHNLHMNQGNSGQFAQENGAWQDGGLLIHFPSRNQWIGAFFAFQSQSFHTDDQNGQTLPSFPGTPPLPLDPKTPQIDAQVRIIAALVNPLGDDPSKESVTLMNTSPQPVDLSGWALADRLKQKHSLNDISLDPGEVVTVPLTGKNAQLGNNGGIITLLNQQGVKVDGVSYTKNDAQKQGWMIVF